VTVKAQRKPVLAREDAMASMLDSLRELASPAILSIVTRQTNESESAVSRAFSAAIPAIAATIANRCDDGSFMK